MQRSLINTTGCPTHRGALQHLKSYYLAGYLTRKGEELCQRLFDSLRDMMRDTEKIKSVCSPKTL